MPQQGYRGRVRTRTTMFEHARCSSCHQCEAHDFLWHTMAFVSDLSNCLPDNHGEQLAAAYVPGAFSSRTVHVQAPSAPDSTPPRIFPAKVPLRTSAIWAAPVVYW